jgi:hypothetical protein
MKGAVPEEVVAVILVAVDGFRGWEEEEDDEEGNREGRSGSHGGGSEGCWMPRLAPMFRCFARPLCSQRHQGRLGLPSVIDQQSNTEASPRALLGPSRSDATELFADVLVPAQS